MGNCCRQFKNEADQQEIQKYEKVEINDNADYSNYVFDLKYIREDELNKIKFTKEGLTDLIESLRRREYIQKFQDETIKISILDDSILTSDFMLIRCEAQIPKEKFSPLSKSLSDIINGIFDKEKRLKWDNNMKEIEILENINSQTIIVKTVTNKVLMVNSREMIEKRYEWYDNNIYYNYSSSIPDNIYSPSEDPVRVLSYIAINILWEDELNFYLDSINQYDIKMNIPQAMMLLSLPMKMKDFINKLVEFVKNE